MNLTVRMMDLLKNYFNNMAYLQESDLENLILEDIDPSFSTWITSVIAMVQSYIDQYCETTFENAAAATKYFDGSGSNEIYVGDIQSVSEILIFDTTGAQIQSLSNSDYSLYPYNESVKSIIKLSPGGSYRPFPGWAHAVKVTGVWGYATVPGAIKLAAIKLAAQIINQGLKGGKVSQENLGSYTVSYEKVDETVDVLGIREILNQYRKINLGI